MRTSPCTGKPHTPNRMEKTPSFDFELILRPFGLKVPHILKKKEGKIRRIPPGITRPRWQREHPAGRCRCRPRAPGQGRLCRAPRPHPRLRQLGSSLLRLHIGCLLLPFPSDSETCLEYLAGRSAPLPEQGGSGCAAGIPPRRAQGGSRRSPSPETPLKTPCKDAFKGAL